MVAAQTPRRDLFPSNYYTVYVYVCIMHVSIVYYSMCMYSVVYYSMCMYSVVYYSMHLRCSLLLCVHLQCMYCMWVWYVVRIYCIYISIHSICTDYIPLTMVLCRDISGY